MVFIIITVYDVKNRCASSSGRKQHSGRGLEYTCLCPSLNAYLSLHVLLDGSGIVIGNSLSDWLLSVLGRTAAS